MGWHLLLILLCRHWMDPPFADVLSPIVWKRSRLSFLPPSSLLLYPFPYGLFMQIQDEESINSMVWSSPHTYTKKANSFSLLMEMAKKAIDRPPENLVCQHSYQYEESTWLRFQVDCHQLNQFVPNVLGKGFLGILKERLLSLEKWPIFLKITTISKVTLF